MQHNIKYTIQYNTMKNTQKPATQYYVDSGTKTRCSLKTDSFYLLRYGTVCCWGLSNFEKTLLLENNVMHCANLNLVELSRHSRAHVDVCFKFLIVRFHWSFRRHWFIRLTWAAG